MFQSMLRLHCLLLLCLALATSACAQNTATMEAAPATKIFAVKFLNYDDGFDVNNKGKLPNLEAYLSPEEIRSITYLDRFGSETYIVKNTTGGTTQLYSVQISDEGKIVPDELIRDYKAGDVLFFSCNAGEMPTTLIRYVDAAGKTYDYIPGLSGQDGSVLYGDNAAPLQKKK